MDSFFDTTPRVICTCGQGGYFGKYDCGCFDDEPVAEERIAGDADKAQDLLESAMRKGAA